MFINYYKMINISSNASNEEINAAIVTYKDKRVKSHMDELMMVLLNESLKPLYDEELERFELSGINAKDYKISNPILEQEINKIRYYIDNRPSESIDLSENSSSLNGCVKYFIYILIGVIITSLARCFGHFIAQHG